MKRNIVIGAFNWNPIIQMSDGVNNKFTRVDGKTFNQDSNIYYFQEAFYKDLSKRHRFVDLDNEKRRDMLFKEIQGSNDNYYFVNKSYKGDKIYKVVQILDVEYNGIVKPVMMAKDVMGTAEELYISDVFERNYDHISKINL